MTIDCIMFVGIALVVMRSVSIKSPAGAALTALEDTNPSQYRPANLKYREVKHRPPAIARDSDL